MNARIADDYERVRWPIKYHDVVFHFENDTEVLHAHAVLLCARSKVFAQMFDSGMLECASRPYVVNIVDFTIHQFRCFLIALYKPEIICSVSMRDDDAFFCIAHTTRLANKYLCRHDFFETLWRVLDSCVDFGGTRNEVFLATAVDCTKRLYTVCTELGVNPTVCRNQLEKVMARFETAPCLYDKLGFKLDALVALTHTDSLLAKETDKE